MRQRKPSYSFRYVMDTMYEISKYGRVWLVVRAYGLSALVVDQHRTTLMSKATAGIDRYDKVTDEDGHAVWLEKYGPHETCEVPGDLAKVFEEIVEHHSFHIAKLIVE